MTTLYFQAGFVLNKKMCFFAKSQPGVYTVLEYQNLLFHKILETEALQKKARLRRYND